MILETSAIVSKLQDVRQSRGLTVKNLCGTAGISTDALYMWRKGKQLISERTYAKLSCAFPEIKEVKVTMVAQATAAKKPVPAAKAAKKVPAKAPAKKEPAKKEVSKKAPAKKTAAKK
jgi:transcriptional regulator with XRE-family HTH domain